MNNHFILIKTREIFSSPLMLFSKDIFSYFSKEVILFKVSLGEIYDGNCRYNMFLKFR